MSLIAQGLFQRKSANFGLGKVAELEDKENQQQAALDAQKEAAEGQMISTGVGIGGSFGVNSALENAKTTKDAVKSANTLIKGGEIGTKGGSLTYTPTGGELLQGAEAKAAIDSAAITADVGQTVKGGVEAAKMAKDAKSAVETVETVSAGADAVLAAETAAASSSTLGTLSTIAAPVAIGLGVAFLLNKLFD